MTSIYVHGLQKDSKIIYHCMKDRNLTSAKLIVIKFGWKLFDAALLYVCYYYILCMVYGR